jgi:hypothetical protein
MAEDFYLDDYGGEFYDGGSDFAIVEPIDFAPIDFTPSPEFLPSFEPSFEPIDFSPLPDLPIFDQTEFFPQLPIESFPTFEPLPDLPIFDHAPFFNEPAIPGLETIQMETEPGLFPIQQPVALPDLPPPVLPFVPTFDPFEPVDFFPLPFVEEQTPPAPTEKLGPCDTPNGLPGPCPQGQYHPQADPCSCVPFPPAPTPTQQPTQQPQQQTQTPKPSAPSPTPAPSPTQQQQACPTGYCKHPQTGQCMQIPVGYVRHPQTQVCTLAAQQTAPPSGETDIFAELKKLPWWVWAGVAGVVLLGGRR